MNLFTQHSVAQAVIALCLTSAVGLLIGKIRVFGVSVGIAGVLFAGLGLAHFGLHVEKETLEFVREFGLILFVYTIGLQVGPGFFGSLRQQGLALNLMAASVVLLGAAMVFGFVKLGWLLPEAAPGVFSGATTNTPSLAAALQSLKGAGASPEQLNAPTIAYAVAYPFGVVGIIVVMLLVRAFFRVKVKEEVDALEAAAQAARPQIVARSFQVENKNLEGLTVARIPGLSPQVVISRVGRDGAQMVAREDYTIRLGDVIHAVGRPHELDSLRVVIGSESQVDLRSQPSDLINKRVILTNKKVIGKNFAELALEGRFGVRITRVTRGGLEFPYVANFRLQFGDILLVVGTEEAIKSVSTEVGDSPKALDHPEMLTFFIGILLGVIVGSIPILLPNLPTPVKLGLAGGPLVVALILSRIGSVGPLFWYLPTNANITLRELGIMLFLSAVGLKSGAGFVENIVNGPGLQWMGLAALVTFIPILLVGLYARAVRKENYATLCGLLAGSMTDPPALAFANQMTGGSAPAVAYSTVYPLVMILRIFCGQMLVMLLFTAAVVVQ